MQKPSKIRKLKKKKISWDYIPHFLPNVFNVPVEMQKEQEETAIRDINIEKRKPGPQHYKLEWYEDRFGNSRHFKVPLFVDKTKKKEEQFHFGLKEVFISVAKQSKYITRTFTSEAIQQRILLLDCQSEQYQKLEKAYYHQSNNDKLLFELECFFLDAEKYE